MSDKKFIPSIITKSREVREKEEQFAVLYDFLKHVDSKFISKQNKRFRNGVIAIISTGMFIPLIIFDILNFLPYKNIIFIGLPILLIIISIFNFYKFMIDKPENIEGIQKIYWPLAITESKKSSEESYLIYDASNELEKKDFAYNSVDFEEVSRIINEIPEALDNYNNEERLKEKLTKLSMVKNNNEMSQNILSKDEIDDMISLYKIMEYSKESELNQKSIDQFFDFEEIEDMRETLNEKEKIAEDNIDFIQKHRDQLLMKKVDNYVEKLKRMSDQEYIQGKVRMGKYFDDIENVTDIFETIEGNFFFELENNIIINRQLSLNNVNRIKDNLKMQKDSFYKDFEMVKNQIEKLNKKDKYNNLIYNLDKTKNNCIKKIESLIKDIEDIKDIFEELKKSGSVDEEELYKIKFNEKKHRNNLIEIANNVDSIGNRLNNGEIKDVSVPVLFSIKDTIRDILEEDLKVINKSITSFKDNEKNISQPIDYVKDHKQSVYKYMSEVPNLLLDEVYNHIKPLNERKEKIKRKSEKVSEQFDEIINSCHDFLDYASFLKYEVDLNDDHTGIYYIPFWKINYDDDKSEIYSLSLIDNEGVLESHIFNSDLEYSIKEKLNKKYSDEIDYDLLDDFNESSEAFKNNYDINFLDHLICKRGVKNLVEQKSE